MSADDELRLVIIDGNNLLHRLRGARPDAGAAAWLIPRLRGALPRGAKAVVVLDGRPEPGAAPRLRATNDVEFRHAGPVDADTAIVELLAARPFLERGYTAVVTDDRALADRCRAAGGLTRRLDWLTARMGRG